MTEKNTAAHALNGAIIELEEKKVDLWLKNHLDNDNVPMHESSIDCGDGDRLIEVMDPDWRLINWSEREAAQLQALKETEAIGFRGGYMEAMEKAKVLVRSMLYNAFFQCSSPMRAAEQTDDAMREIFPSGVGPRGPDRRGRAEPK